MIFKLLRKPNFHYLRWRLLCCWITFLRHRMQQCHCWLTDLLFSAAEMSPHYNHGKTRMSTEAKAIELLEAVDLLRKAGWALRNLNP